MQTAASSHTSKAPQGALHSPSLDTAAELLRLPYPTSHETSRNQFIERCSRDFGLDISKWREPISQWVDAAWQYGTPVNEFLASLKVSPCDLPGNCAVGIVQGHSFSFTERDSLFTRYLEEYRSSLCERDIDLTTFAPDRPAVPHSHPEYQEFLERFQSCGASQTVARELSLRVGRATPTSKIECDGGGILSVNAYPWEPYGAMFTHLTNDDLSHRVLKDKDGLFTPAAGKTFLRSACGDEWYRAVFLIADSRDSVGIENSPVSGMSAPLRRHAQFFPTDTQKGLVLRSLPATLPLNAERFDGVLYARSPLHPFDTLVMYSEATDTLAQAVCQVREEIDRAGGVSTYAYARGYCVISAQNLKDHYTYNRIGARAALNYYEESEIAAWSAVVEPHFPKRGTFPWREVCGINLPRGE